MAGHAQAAQAAAHRRACPALPGVYLFRDRGRPGALRRQGHQPPVARVRSYFSGDDAPEGRPAAPRDPAPSTTSCAATTLEAAVLEVRLIHELAAPLQPPGQATGGRYAYLQAHARRALPAPVGGAGAAGRRRLLPRPAAVAPASPPVAEAIADGGAAAALHAPGRRARPSARAVHVGAARRRHLSLRRRDHRRGRYAAVVERGPAGPRRTTPPSCSTPSPTGCATWPPSERFEEAADIRDRAAALARRCQRHRRFWMRRDAGRSVLSLRRRQRRGAAARAAGPRLGRRRRPTGPIAPRSGPTRRPRHRARATRPTSCRASGSGSTARPPRAVAPRRRRCWRRRSPAWHGSSRAPEDGPDGPVAWPRWVGSSRCS